MAGLSVEFPAAVDPVSLSDMKNFLRVDAGLTADDALILGLISAATLACENFCRRSFINKGFIQTLDAFPYYTDTMVSQMAYPPSYYALPRLSTTLWNYSQMIKLWRPRLVSVDRITYMDQITSSYVDMVPQPSPWYPQTLYAYQVQIADNNGNVQTCLSNQNPSIQLKTGVKAPLPWNKTQGQFTTETSGVVWRNEGPLTQGEFGSYIVDSISEPARIFPGIVTPGPTAGYWPSVLYVPNAVQIHFTAGYGPNPSDVPASIISAIMQVVAALYEVREPVKDDEQTLPPHVKMMLWPHVVLDFAPTRG
jgi:Phage gp6-like head-tail connector protein